MADKKEPQTTKKSGILSLLKPYNGLVIKLIVFALFSNGINLWLPGFIAQGIGAYTMVI
jgi:ATP-binding cassette subfamily B protein